MAAGVSGDGCHSYTSVTTALLWFCNELLSISQHLICNYHVYKLGEAGGKRKDNYIFIITCITFRLLACTARKTSIWAHNFTFQWSSCYRTINTFCVSISSGNPVPRNKELSHTPSRGFPDLAPCHCIRKFMLRLPAVTSLPLLPPPYSAWGAAGIGVSRPQKAAEFKGLGSKSWAPTTADY